jgi:hypothetical protein
VKHVSKKLGLIAGLQVGFGPKIGLLIGLKLLKNRAL